MVETMMWLALGAALGIALAIYLAKRGAKQKKPSETSLMKRLVKLTHDPEVARRLIAGERSRHPELSDLALLRRVIRRLERDRRR